MHSICGYVWATDACRQFIQFASNPKRQALLAPYGIGLTQPEVLKSGHIDLKHAKLTPSYPDNIKKDMPSNGLYWKSHQNAVIERFNQWMISWFKACLRSLYCFLTLRLKCSGHQYGVFGNLLKDVLE